MNSPLNFGMMSGIGQAMGMNPFGGNMFGSMGAHQFIIDRIRQQQQGPQVGTAAQIAASGLNNQDPNNASATGFSSIGGEMYADPSAREATGAPRADLTGQGYATNRFGGFAGPTGGGTIPANVATANNFSTDTAKAASQIFGNSTQFQPRKRLITL